MSNQLTLDVLKKAVTGSAAAFRCLTEYQPAGGPGDKVFPPTYEGGKYATEKRRLEKESEPVDCVLLDSVQSQANRMEEALRDAWDREQIPLPVISVDFGGNDLAKSLRVTSLDAPHRIADAILRDSLLNGKAFRESDKGKQLDHLDNRHATALFELCPTALVFGMWDSTGPRGGLGAKFARAMVSEIVGINAVAGVKTSSRIDPAEIRRDAGPLYVAKEGGWTLEEEDAKREKSGPIKLGKDGKPSEANHGNIPPSIGDGGVTIVKAVQTTVLSLPALRRLRFPINEKRDPRVDDAARTVLAALGLCAATLFQEQGCDLRSRCQLVPVDAFGWELIGKPGEDVKILEITAETAVSVYKSAVKEAAKVKLPWMEDVLELTPSPELVELVRRSQNLAAGVGAEEGGE